MWILPLIGYIGLLLGFAFLTLAIASGLYYLSELVEEHTVFTKKLLTRLIYTVVVLQLLLLAVDRLPLWLSLLNILSHGMYLRNLRFFPIVRLSDPVFIASCLLVLVNHYLWFLHFSTPPARSKSYHASLYSPPVPLPAFSEIASFFFLQVWLVPFALFVSLSASENVLPSMGSEYATDPGSLLASPSTAANSIRSSSAVGSLGAMLSQRSASSDVGGRSQSAVRDGSLGLGDGRRGRRKGGGKGLVRVAVDGVREWVGETGEALGLWRGARRWQA